MNKDPNAGKELIKKIIEDHKKDNPTKPITFKDIFEKLREMRENNK